MSNPQMCGRYDGFLENADLGGRTKKQKETDAIGGYQFNAKNRENGLALMRAIPDGFVTATFFDPQYRGVLDKLSYGNEGVSRGKERSSLPQMSEELIVQFILEINRVTVPSGHLFLWVDKFHLCEGIVGWLAKTNFSVVDMVVWNKETFGMGYRTRRTCEYVIVIQKKPIRAKGIWLKHDIRDVWSEKIETKRHAHAKPLKLQQELIQAVSVENDVILDPAMGGGSVLLAAQASNRIFIGCDIDG
jgi:site-specific DNA-methyltransferase (adenine-specific)